MYEGVRAMMIENDKSPKLNEVTNEKANFGFQTIQGGVRNYSHQQRTKYQGVK